VLSVVWHRIVQSTRLRASGRRSGADGPRNSSASRTFRGIKWFCLRGRSWTPRAKARGAPATSTLVTSSTRNFRPTAMDRLHRDRRQSRRVRHLRRRRRAKRSPFIPERHRLVGRRRQRRSLPSDRFSAPPAATPSFFSFPARWSGEGAPGPRASLTTFSPDGTKIAYSKLLRNSGLEALPGRWSLPIAIFDLKKTPTKNCRRLPAWTLPDVARQPSIHQRPRRRDEPLQLRLGSKQTKNSLTTGIRH